MPPPIFRRIILFSKDNNSHNFDPAGVLYRVSCLHYSRHSTGVLKAGGSTEHWALLLNGLNSREIGMAHKDENTDEAVLLVPSPRVAKEQDGGGLPVQTRR